MSHNQLFTLPILHTAESPSLASPSSPIIYQGQPIVSRRSKSLEAEVVPVESLSKPADDLGSDVNLALVPEESNSTMGSPAIELEQHAESDDELDLIGSPSQSENANRRSHSLAVSDVTPVEDLPEAEPISLVDDIDDDATEEDENIPVQQPDSPVEMVVDTELDPAAEETPEVTPIEIAPQEEAKEVEPAEDLIESPLEVHSETDLADMLTPPTESGEDPVIEEATVPDDDVPIEVHPSVEPQTGVLAAPTETSVAQLDDPELADSADPLVDPVGQLESAVQPDDMTKAESPVAEHMEPEDDDMVVDLADAQPSEEVDFIPPEGELLTVEGPAASVEPVTAEDPEETAMDVDQEHEPPMAVAPEATITPEVEERSQEESPAAQPSPKPAVPSIPSEVYPTHAPSLQYMRKVSPISFEPTLPVSEAHTYIITAPTSPLRSRSTFIFVPEESRPQPPPEPLSPTQSGPQFPPQYKLPPLKSLPAEFNPKGRPIKRQRKKEKEAQKNDGKKDKDKDDWTPQGLMKWGIVVRANPVFKRVQKATKCLSTREWGVSLDAVFNHIF